MLYDQLFHVFPKTVRQCEKLICVVSLQCDLLDLPAVGQLEKDAKYALVYQLLKIFLTQRLDAYLEFEAANSTLLKSYGKLLVWGQGFFNTK